MSILQTVSCLDGYDPDALRVEKAREAGKKALQLAEHHQLNEWYFRIESLLKSLEAETNSTAEFNAPAEAESTPAVQQMTAGLREYALLAAV
jgi:formate dehydrogenase maturation protein FdhE